MITREQFEAHVRAEADERYPTQEAEREADRTLFAMLNNEQRMRAGGYIAARMEHEWPLVEALGKLQRMGLRTSMVSAHGFYKEHNLKQTADSVKNELIPAWDELISPYTTPTP
jgi:hypothetical protein